MFVRVCEEDFSQQDLYDELNQQTEEVAGAIVTFTGKVRDYNANGSIEGIELEHYPGMTESALEHLLSNAIERFGLLNGAVVHRVGKLPNHAQIVWVGTSCAHRQNAFDAACFIMDMLKKSVPIWKKEWAKGQSNWVEAKSTDEEAALRWLKKTT